MKLSRELIESKIKKVEYSKLGEKTSVCHMTLQNGFEIVTTSACIDPKNFDPEIGNKLAYEQAIDKVWELEGYLAQENKYASDYIASMPFDTEIKNPRTEE